VSPPACGIRAFPSPEQYLIMLTGRDEHRQVELVKRFTAEGVNC
jgi:hypothetical protein